MVTERLVLMPLNVKAHPGNQVSLTPIAIREETIQEEVGRETEEEEINHSLRLKKGSQINLRSFFCPARIVSGKSLSFIGTDS